MRFRDLEKAYIRVVGTIRHSILYIYCKNHLIFDFWDGLSHNLLIILLSDQKYRG